MNYLLDYVGAVEIYSMKPWIPRVSLFDNATHKLNQTRMHSESKLIPMLNVHADVSSYLILGFPVVDNSTVYMLDTYAVLQKVNTNS